MLSEMFRDCPKKSGDVSGQIRGHIEEILFAYKIIPQYLEVYADAGHTSKLADGAGLYLEVMPTGARYWRLKYRIEGKEKRLVFCFYPEVRPPEAREKVSPPGRGRLRC